MAKNKDSVPDIEKIYKSTKNTIIGGAATAAYCSVATFLTGALTAYGVSKAADDKTKKAVALVGASATAVELGLTIAAFKHLDGCIDNHDDVVKLSVLNQFLNTKGDDERDNLLDNMINDLHTKAVNEKGAK